MNNHSKGFTLVELLVSTTLCLLLFSWISGFLVSVQAAFSNQQQEIEFQERLRYAFYRIGKDIENAGFLGCLRSTTPNAPVIFGSEIPPEYRSAITITKNSNDKPEWWVAYADGRRMNARFRKPRILVATDCEKAVIGLKPDLSIFRQVVQMAPMVAVHYDLRGNEKRKIYGLYRSETGERSEELIAGIQNLQMILGIDEHCNGQVVYKENLAFPVPAHQISAVKLRLNLYIRRKQRSYERIFQLANRCFATVLK